MMQIKLRFYLLCFLFVISLSEFVFGQTERLNVPRITTSVSYNYLEDLKLHFLFSYSLKKHEPFIGMEFPLQSEHVSNYGFNAGYKFYPNTSRQAFDLFFLYLAQVNSRKLYSASAINGFSFHNLIGYGFDVYFTRTIFMNHFLAAGIEQSWFGSHGKFTDLSLVGSLGFGLKIKSSKSNK